MSSLHLRTNCLMHRSHKPVTNVALSTMDVFEHSMVKAKVKVRQGQIISRSRPV